ncbi:hypothetical protein LRP88_03431 [Fusarium phalaenopsidis]
MSVSTVAHPQARRSVQNTQVEASFSQLGQFPNDKDTFLPGRWVDPRKLENVLNDLFDDQYAVSMRNNSYVDVLENEKRDNDSFLGFDIVIQTGSERTLYTEDPLNWYVELVVDNHFLAYAFSRFRREPALKSHVVQLGVSAELGAWFPKEPNNLARTEAIDTSGGDQGHLKDGDDAESVLNVLFCGRTEKTYPHPLIVAHLPFPETIFDQVRTEFRVHGSIARVINRNTRCSFMDMPFLYTEDSGEIATVYNCRTAGTWPCDMALSVSFSPRKLTTYAVVYGCDDEAADILKAKLTGTDHPVFHPMLLPTLLADMERERQVGLLRKNSLKMDQLTVDLTMNKGLEGSQMDHNREPIELWQDMSYLQNGLRNWQRQMQRMIIHLERSSSPTILDTKHYGIEVERSLEKLTVPGSRIQKRLEELIDEYDEHIRECATVTEGLKLAMSMDTRKTNQEIAHSSLEVSRLAQNDGSLMKLIAFVTMFFLPATFTSTFFSMDFFDWPKAPGSIATSYIWVYALVAAILTLTTVGADTGGTDLVGCSNVTNTDTSYCCDHNANCCDNGVGRFNVYPSKPKPWATWNRQATEYLVVGTMYTGDPGSSTAEATTTGASSSATTTSEAASSATGEAQTPESTEAPASGLSTGAQAGIGVGVGVGALVIAAVVYLFWKMRKNEEAAREGNHSSSDHGAPQMGTAWQQTHHLPKEPQELHGHQFQGYGVRAELPAQH